MEELPVPVIIPCSQHLHPCHAVRRARLLMRAGVVPAPVYSILCNTNPPAAFHLFIALPFFFLLSHHSNRKAAAATTFPPKQSIPACLDLDPHVSLCSLLSARLTSDLTATHNISLRSPLPSTGSACIATGLILSLSLQSLRIRPQLLVRFHTQEALELIHPPSPNHRNIRSHGSFADHQPHRSSASSP